MNFDQITVIREHLEDSFDNVVFMKTEGNASHWLVNEDEAKVTVWYEDHEVRLNAKGLDTPYGVLIEWIHNLENALYKLEPLHKAKELVLAKGYRYCLGKKLENGDTYVLVDRGEYYTPERYVVWRYAPQDDAFYGGKYFRTYELGRAVLNNMSDEL